MFENLTNRFEGILRNIRGKGRLGADEVEEVLREIRVALLDADVHLGVVRTLQDRIRERALGEELSGVLNPGQQVVRIVLEELTGILGGATMPITFASKPPTVVLLAGLQGSGKTTASAKLALWFKAKGRNPLLVGADLARPAAVEQLRTLAERIDVPVFSQPGDPVSVAAAGLVEARRLGRDVLICDTAGRLAIDDHLMAEVAQIAGVLEPHYTFFVLDAMTGQDAVNVAGAFHQRLELDAVVLTKLDGDARGGAALSVSQVVGRPIAFASTGEALEDLEPFHPDRLASRILGMGDIETLIEKAEETFEAEQAEAAAARMLEGTFTLDDFLEQLRQIRSMGPVGDVMQMVPGMGQQVRDVEAELDEHRIDRIEGIIHSMTPDERTDPDVIDGSRRARIAAGSGTQVSEVSRLVRQFREMRTVMKQMGGSGSKGRGRGPKRGRKGKRQGGGRTTPRGPVKVPKEGLALPGLGGDDLVGGLDPGVFGRGPPRSQG
ncbi:MAG: signal recognition particle protein [Acidimicrobiales bacterium]|jgi:signal recognition particle subunit SRP54|nr:signal recognition particle protein [Acidimicrobiales bacterium]|tara:strand:+ start:3786 stop:5267 length:1482 start_codon:yes stop_codon:yes gene_type:complete